MTNDNEKWRQDFDRLLEGETSIYFPFTIFMLEKTYLAGRKAGQEENKGFYLELVNEKTNEIETLKAELYKCEEREGREYNLNQSYKRENEKLKSEVERLKKEMVIAINQTASVLKEKNNQLAEKDKEIDDLREALKLKSIAHDNEQRMRIHYVSETVKAHQWIKSARKVISADIMTAHWIQELKEGAVIQTPLAKWFMDQTKHLAEKKDE